MFYKIVYILLVVFMKVLYRFEITGKRNIPKTGPVIIAPNHMSYLDPIMVALVSGQRPLNSMGKASLLKIPVFGRFLRAVNTFPVNRGIVDKGAIVQSLKLLSNGEVLLIFPEGTRHRDGKLGKPFPGVSSIALKTGASIVPVGIIGTDKVLPNGSKLPRFPKLKAVIGEPIQVEKVATADRKEREAELTSRLMNEIENLIAGGKG